MQRGEPAIFATFVRGGDGLPLVRATTNHQVRMTPFDRPSALARRPIRFPQGVRRANAQPSEFRREGFCSNGVHAFRPSLRTEPSLRSDMARRIHKASATVNPNDVQEQVNSCFIIGSVRRLFAYFSSRTARPISRLRSLSVVGLPLSVIGMTGNWRPPSSVEHILTTSLRIPRFPRISRVHEATAPRFAITCSLTWLSETPSKTVPDSAKKCHFD